MEDLSADLSYSVNAVIHYRARFRIAIALTFLLSSNEALRRGNLIASSLPCCYRLPDKLRHRRSLVKWVSVIYGFQAASSKIIPVNFAGNGICHSCFCQVKSINNFQKRREQTIFLRGWLDRLSINGGKLHANIYVDALPIVCRQWMVRDDCFNYKKQDPAQNGRSRRNWCQKTTP